MKEIINELKDIWPAGAVLVFLILAYVGVRKFASPKDWGSLRVILWNNIKLSCDVTRAKIQGGNSVLITLGYFRENKSNHYHEYNSILLNLYEKCISYHCCFWWSDHALSLFLVLILVCICLFKFNPLLAAVCVVVYFGSTILAGDRAKDLQKQVDQHASDSRAQQINYLETSRITYEELS